MKASAAAPMSIIDQVLARPVKDKPFDSKLSVQEMRERATGLFNKYSITADDIYGVFDRENGQTHEPFIQVLLNGLTEDNKFLQIYLNCNATASFFKGDKHAKSKISENEFVAELATLGDRTKSVQY